jgi:hypothetical protein
MTDTPRTDAEVDEQGQYIHSFVFDHTYNEVHYVRADFARQLERELAEAKREAALWHEVMCGLNEELAAAQRDAERYRC